MKILLIILCFVTISSSDEMQRVQNIVDDISKLRADYEQCKKELGSSSKGTRTFEAVAMQNDEKLQKYEMSLRDEKQRNKILLDEIDTLTKNKHNISNLENKIRKLEKIVKNQEISLKTKEKVIKNLKNNKIKTKEVVENSLKNKKMSSSEAQLVCEKKNSFPKLVMKEGFQESVNDIEETHTFKASAFRLKNDARIYDEINGKEIDIWEKSTSFTSNEKSNKWVRVTGYFIDKKWHPSKEELWVKSKDVIQR